MNELKSSETENLELHVNLCEQRYQTLSNRLENLEDKVDELNKTLNQFKNEAFKTLIGVAGTIIVAMIGFIAVILNVVPQ